MASLTVARDDQVASVYGESHALWGSGLTLADYLGLWRDLERTDWARRHAGFCAWVGEEGRLLSSVKLYRPQACVNGRTARITVIGALFTPSALRGRGHASELVRAVLARARRQGDPLVLLFTDIGTGFYNGFGFRALPAEEQWGSLPRNPRAPAGWSLREMTDDDLELVRRAHLDFCRGRRFAMIRDAEHWSFLRARANRFFERLDDARLCYREQIAQADGRFAGYLVTVEGRGEWNMREVGAVGGDPGTMASILRLGSEQARRVGFHGFYGWLPPAVRRRLPEWGMHNRRRRRAVPMMLALDPAVDLSALTTPDEAFVPFLDQF